MKKAIVLVVILVIAFGVLHTYSASRIAEEIKSDLETKVQQGVFEVDLNPFSNKAVFTFAASSGAPSGVDEPYLEGELAAAARKRFDIFSMVNPYSARIVLRKSGTWFTQAKMSTDGDLWASPAAETNGQSPLARLTRGTPLMVLSATGALEGKWLQVRTEDGRTGWVRESETERN